MAPRARDRARQALDGNFQCLGYGLAKIPTGPGWHEDPFHGYRWPVAFFPRVDFVANGRHCDVKIPWELSRLQYLVWLAEGAIFEPENEPVYRDRFADIVRDWMKSNPVGYGVNWCCAMEVAIRAINLSIAFSIFAGRLDPEMSARIVQTLDDHVRFIARFPETSDVPGNHYLADLAGIAFVPAILGDMRSATERMRVFAEEAARQFEPDGSHLERAPVYHRLCLELVAGVAAMAIHINDASKDRLVVIIDRGVQFCRSIGSANGRLPIVGDCDSGHVFWFGGDARDFSGIDQFASMVERRGVAVTSDLAHWLGAIAGISDTEGQVSSSGQSGDLGVTDCRGGLLAAHMGDLSVVMRVGSQGLKGRAGHDHDDALSLWVSKNGHDLLVDEGCHSYTLDPKIRARNISSSAHNVVQPRSMNRFRLVEGSISKSVRGAPTASHWEHCVRDGIASLNASLAVPSRTGQPFGMCSRRVDLISPYSLCVEDSWVLKQAGAVEILWHLGPGLRTLYADVHKVSFVDARTQIVMSLTVDSSAPATLETFEFEYSPVYGSARMNFGIRIVLSEHEAAIVKSIFTMQEGALAAA